MAVALFIRSACLTGYAELARSVGLDTGRMLREAGLERSCLTDPDQMILCDAVVALLENSARAAGIDDLGLRLAESRRLSNLGPIALAIRDAATLRQALETAIHYLPLHNQSMTVSFERAGDVQLLKMDVLTDARLLGRQRIELAVGVTYQVIRQVSGGLWRTPAVWFSHSAPGNLMPYLRFFGPWVEFGQECNAILLDNDQLNRPLATADPVMAEHVKQYLEPLLAQTSLSVAEKARRLVHDLLVSRRASADLVAAGLGVTRRTLHRRLAEDGSTFSSILETVRREEALRCVQDADLPLRDAAHRLGFADQSGFSRWFRAEFNCSPREWRTTDLARDRVSGLAADWK